MHRDPETAEPGNGISIYAFLYYVENYGPRRAIPRTRPALTRNVRDNLPRLDYIVNVATRRDATLSFLSPVIVIVIPVVIVISCASLPFSTLATKM